MIRGRSWIEAATRWPENNFWLEAAAINGAATVNTVPCRKVGVNFKMYGAKQRAQRDEVNRILMRIFFTNFLNFLCKIATFPPLINACWFFTWWKDTIFWKLCILPWPKIPDFEDIGFFVSQVCLISVIFSCKLYRNSENSAQLESVVESLNSSQNAESREVKTKD